MVENAGEPSCGFLKLKIKNEKERSAAEEAYQEGRIASGQIELERKFLERVVQTNRTKSAPKDGKNGNFGEETNGSKKNMEIIVTELSIVKKLWDHIKKCESIFNNYLKL
jgi:hypothetical protein